MTRDEIWLSPALRGHVELMTHLCQSADNTLLIIGPENAGKSALFRYFCRQSIRGCQVLGITAQAWEYVEDFMEVVAKALSLKFSEDLTAFQAVKNHLESQTSHQPATILLIDDAHLLNDELLQALYALFKYDADAAMPLQLILFGESSLELRLFSPQMSAMINGKIYTLELEPWSLQEVRQFLGKAKELALLSLEQSQDIFESTQGLPGLVAVQRAELLKQFKKEDGMFLQSLTKWRKNPLVLGALVGVIGGGSYILINHTQNDTVLGQIPAGIVQQEDSVRPMQTAHADHQIVDKQDAYPAQADLQAMVEPEEMSLVVEETEIKAVPLAAVESFEVLEVSAPSTETAVTVPEKDNEMNQETEVIEEVVEISDAIESATTEVLPTAQTAVPTTPVLALSDEANSKIALPLSEEEKFLLTLDKEAYTLQLVGARNESNIKQFMQQHGIEYQAAYFKTKLSGKDWFVVVFGEYATEQDAKAAMAALPGSLADAPLQPWVRKISAIQADINKIEHS